MESEITVSRNMDALVEHLSIGQYISVELVNQEKDRFETTLIGVKAKKFLVLELPNVIQYGAMREFVLPRQQLIIRTINEKTNGSCMGFRSIVEGAIKKPYPIFFAAFPNEVETRELRNEARQHTAIPALMFKNEPRDAMKGLIIDLSSGGCRFELEVEASVKRLKAQSMYLQFDDPMTHTQVTRLAKVCSQRKEGNKIAIGFAFAEKLAATG